MPSGRKLKGRELARFKAARTDINQRLADLATKTTIASSQ